MGAFVLPVFLVPALTAVLAVGLLAETHRARRRVAPSLVHTPAS